MENTFSTIDYLVIAAYLGGIVVLGAIFYKRQNSLEEYFHASGRIPWWAVGISIFATALSPITYLALPGWIFLKDSRTALVGSLVSLGFVFLTVAIWVPVWGRLRTMSIYEYLERRYHASIRVLGAVLFILTMVFWLGTALVTAAQAFESATGFDGRWCLIVITLLGTAYTVLGGMRAVIWTDVAQFLIFVLGYAVIGVILLIAFSWQPTEIYDIASSQISEVTHHPHTKLISFEFSLSVEATIWAILFSQLIGAVAYGTRQINVQRMHAAGSRRAMYKAVVAGSVCALVFIFFEMLASWGFVAFYHKFAQTAGTFEHPDQVLPHFIAQQLPVVLRSLMMAAILAALMSSFDSAINSMSNVAISDFYRRHIKREGSDRHYVFVAKILTLFFGLLLLAFSLWQYAHSQSTALERLGKLNNLIAAPMMSFFVLGIFSKRTNAGGVLCGFFASILFSLVFNGFPGLIRPMVPGINWMWIGGFATIVNVVVGYAASFLLTAPRPEKVAGLTIFGRKSDG